MKIGVSHTILFNDLLSDAGDNLLTDFGSQIFVGIQGDIIQRIPIKKACQGYYLRWYYNGWHYWNFLPGRNNLLTEGENYRTIGTQKINMGSGQISLSQIEALRTIMNTREVYILTDYGWRNIRIEPGSLTVKNNFINGYEFEFVAIIGSRDVSVTGYSPVQDVPYISPEPDPDICEISLGTQIWMCKNYEGNYPGSKVYNNDEANRTIYGGLYTFNMIKESGFCPVGWHVPTLAEWQILVDFLGGALVAGGKLKMTGTSVWNAPNTGATNESGFTALPTGFRYRLNGNFNNAGELVYFWSSTQYEFDDTKGYYRELFNDNATVYREAAYKTAGKYVRCLKD